MPRKVIVTLAASVLFMFCSSSAQQIKIEIDGGKTVRPINPWLYGINTARWDESLFPGPTDEMLRTADRDAIEKIKASGVTLLKYPGGNDADQYVWNSSANNATEMNTDEYIALCREVGAEPFITVNFNESPDLAAEWVRYCNIVKGYNVKLWEVGDEQWGTWARGHAPPEEYAKKYINFVKAMRAVDPSIKVATNVPLGLHPENWAERVLKAAGEYVDMLTYTFFPQPSGKENDDTLMTTVGKFRTLVTKLREDVERAVGPQKASSMYFINVGYNSASHSPGPQTLQMINAIWTADMLGCMA
jgi:alpha-L-arabinofuranosidase